jgi:hypothetical protein
MRPPFGADDLEVSRVLVWVKALRWWQWLLIAFAVLMLLDLVLLLTHSGSIDPTDPSNLH